MKKEEWSNWALKNSDTSSQEKEANKDIKKTVRKVARQI